MVSFEVAHTQKAFILSRVPLACIGGKFKLQDQPVCPKCGSRVGKGSTHCFHCGYKLSEAAAAEGSIASIQEEIVPPAEGTKAPNLSNLEERMLGMLGGEEEPQAKETGPREDEELATLPELDESELEELEIDSKEVPVGLAEAAKPQTPVSDEAFLPPLDMEAESRPTESPAALVPEEARVPARDESSRVGERGESALTWEYSDRIPEMEPEDVKEGNPFQEIEPPRVVSEEGAPHPGPTTEETPSGAEDEPTRRAVAHLFPQGRGVTSRQFIDAVVGKPTRIGADLTVVEMEAPTCPQCGAAVTQDGFDYPPYVYEAMAKARLENGLSKIKENEYEKAIESFEIAKKLFERAGNSKMVEESTRRANEGYDAMAESHIVQGERHLKDGQYEWAVVQFKKARELYMFSTDPRKRARCAEKARESYSAWGRELESEGDTLAKSGETREALTKYKEAAEKFREGEDSKGLAGLEKRIRKA